MSTASDSSVDYRLPAMPFAPARTENAIYGQGGIWLDGDVLGCTCPDCNAPMSIRLWLMTADCYRCGASLELTEEQEHEAFRLLREHEEARRAESMAAAAAISPTMVRRRPQPRTTRDPVAPSPVAPVRESVVSPAPTVAQPGPELPGAAEPQPEARPRRVAAAQVHRGARARIRKVYERGGLAVWLSEWLHDLPAWLVSAVVHAVVLLLLALWTQKLPEEPLSITLSSSVSPEDELGEQGDIQESNLTAVDLEDPGAMPVENLLEDTGLTDEPEVDFQEVDPEAIVPPPEPVGNVPDMAFHQPAPTPLNVVETGQMFAGRNPQARAQTVIAAGGTTMTEAAVARALRWLERHQNTDGSWSLNAFNKAPLADGKGSGLGRVESNMAGTAMALLPFLGAGQTHLHGEYQELVRKGLNWIAENQGEDGDTRGSGDGRMYAHGQAAIVLNEAYAMTRDEQLRPFAQMSLNYIAKGQHGRGGWRYSPGEAADTSVVGWQIMALRSGREANLDVAPQTFDLAAVYLDRAKTDSLGGKYGYQPGRPPTPAMTAEALLCRLYLGWPPDHPGIRAGVDYLIKEHLPSKDDPNVYYWYYATQVMHHVGGEPWDTWNARMREVLVAMQEKVGVDAGSWEPRGPHSGEGGRIYMTALAACILEVYYRHMPLYQMGTAPTVAAPAKKPEPKETMQEVGGNLNELHTRPGETELHTRGAK